MPPVKHTILCTTNTKVSALCLLYLWLAIFLYPMIHDLIHELGHAAVALSICGSRTTSITLGQYTYCPHNPNQSITFCVTPKWFYQSLYRTSATFFRSPGNGYDPAKCSNATIMMGGIFGFSLAGWLMLASIVTPLWMFVVKATSSKSLLVGLTFLFVPLKWLAELELPPQSEFNTKAVKMVLGFGAIVIQFDQLNEFFYSFFPSRLIIWEFMEFGDGSQWWRYFGVSEATILNVSYAVWVMLFVCYLAIFYSYYLYYKQVPSDKSTSDDKLTNEEHRSHHQLPSNVDLT
ncbi:hypothetical protein HDV05_008160 [Chytridiales sp. JEL 0842]|nr:hypothetical protein HDV05_008160 [Chytridiales sp. JEL 0842]